MSEVDEDVKLPTKAELEALEAEENTPEPVEEEAPEYTDVELAAMEQGWNPDGVEGKRNLSAEEFMDRQHLYDDIRKLKRKINKQHEDFETLKQHHKRVEEMQREKIMKELRDKKREAYENDDIDQIMDIDDQIAELKSEADTAAEQSPQTNPVFQEWLEDNSWYAQDDEKREFADIVGIRYIKQNPTAPQDEVLDYVSKRVRENFAPKPKEAKPTKVEASRKGNKAQPKAKMTSASLSEEERMIMKTLIRTGVFDSEEEYMAEYAELSGV